MSKPSLISIHDSRSFESAVERASSLLRLGEVVALPSETVYGLAGNALNESAIRRIFSLKRRPASNPLIVHIASFEVLDRCVHSWPETASKLARAFWPGPMTLILPKTAIIPNIVTAGGGTVAVRWPSHPFFQEVLRCCNFPLAAPSANLSGQLSPTQASHVHKAFTNELPLIVDGGHCQVGIESTVLDLSISPPRILRPGTISESAIRALIGEVSLEKGFGAGPAKSPGLMPQHYAPKARLMVHAWNGDKELQDFIESKQLGGNKLHFICLEETPAFLPGEQVSIIPNDPEAYARAIYGELHRCDDAGAEVIVVERPPRSSEWRGIADRLERASFREA